MQINKNFQIQGQHGKPILTDIFYTKSEAPLPIIIYTHGINGFKDWGNFDLIAKQFAEAGFAFVKFNFSHNGTTPEHPEDFADLEAYGNDNYTIQLDDLKAVIDWACDEQNEHSSYLNTDKIYLLGHSKGGCVVLVKAAEDIRVKGIVTWAAANECKTPWGNWPEEKMNDWKEKGVQYLENKRTHQQLPLYYQLYENYMEHQHRLNTEAAVRSLKIPMLICHGSDDPAVPIEKAYELHHWNPDAELFILPRDHVFGRKHPWERDDLPEPMQKVIDKTASFLKSQL